MSQVFGSFDNKPIVSAGEMLEQFDDNGWDSSSFKYKANSFRCPIGEEWGRGWLLMARSDVQNINTAGFKTLVLGDDSGQVTLPGLILKSAFRLLPGASQDPNALYLVEVVDRRFVAAQSFVNKRFNLRYPNSAQITASTALGIVTGGYSTESTNAGTAWTYQGIGNTLIAALPSAVGGGIGSMTFPNVSNIAVTPENLRYECVSAWHALCKFSGQLGCQCKYDPIADTFSIVEMGRETKDQTSPMSQGGGANTTSDSSKMSDKATTRTSSDALLEDAETFVGSYVYPEKVSVCFPTFYNDSNSFGIANKNNGFFYSVDVAGSDVNIANAGTRYTGPSANVIAGTRQILYDPMLAMWTDVTVTDPDNLGVLTNRAQEVTYKYYTQLVDDTNARLVFIGAKSYVPGPCINEVTWREYGDGLKTEVNRWRPTTQIDIQREMPERGVQMVLGKTNTAVNKSTGASGNINVYVGLTAGTEAFNGASTTITAYNYIFDIPSGKWVICAFFGGLWRIIAAEC